MLASVTSLSQGLSLYKAVTFYQRDPMIDTTLCATSPGRTCWNRHEAKCYGANSGCEALTWSRHASPPRFVLKLSLHLLLWGKRKSIKSVHSCTLGYKPDLRSPSLVLLIQEYWYQQGLDTTWFCNPDAHEQV